MEGDLPALPTCQRARLGVKWTLMKFKDKGRASMRLARELGVDESLAAEIVPIFARADLDDIFGSPSQSNDEEGYASLMVASVCWVIRDDDLPTLKTAVAAVLAALAAHATGAAGTTAATALGTAIVAWWQVKRKGVSLSHTQIQILAALKAAPGSASSDVAAWIEARCGVAFTAEEVLSELEKLNRTRIGDGSVVALADKDHSGAWSACGI